MSENRQFCDETGFIVGDDVWKADRELRKDQAAFNRLCDALRVRNARRAKGAQPRPVAKPAPIPRPSTLSCWQCGAHFRPAPGGQGPRPRFCSPAHRTAWHREKPKREASVKARDRAAYLARRTRGAQRVDLTGQRFGLLVVVEDVTPAGQRGARRWLARCDCGGSRVTRADRFKNGDAKSCGCMAGRRVTL